MSFSHVRKTYAKTQKRKSGYRDLEKKLDRIFSEYIRLRDANEHGYCQCVTCGKFYFWKEIHCGHFISRSVKATRFNEINSNSQCVRCNSFRQGEHHIYREQLIDMYGKNLVESLEHEAKLGGSLDTFDLQQKIDLYRGKVKKLKEEKGL